MEALQIIVPAVTLILGLFIGYFLKQSEYNRQRKDELADRDFNRRAAIYDMRIQEAREYVDRMGTFIEFVEQVTGILKKSNMKSEAESEFESLGDAVLSLPAKMSELSTKRAGIEILNDEEIKNLFKELRRKYSPAVNQFMDVIEKISREDYDIDLEVFKEGIDFDKTVNDLHDANKIFTKMKARLDKLAEKVPGVSSPLCKRQRN
jgi:hypothetical protein